jgi:hypothetical protein
VNVHQAALEQEVAIPANLSILVLFLKIVIMVGAAMIKLEPGIVRVKVLFFLLEENHGSATLLKDLSVQAKKGISF